MLEQEDFIPVKVDGGLIVWHTPQEYARLWRGVDKEACEVIRMCWCDGDCEGCTCGSA